MTQTWTLVRKGLRDARGVAIGGALGVMAIVALHVALYPQYNDLNTLQYPDALSGIFGEAGSIGRPEGYITSFWANTLMIVAVLAIIVGTGATASEEQNGTLDVLLAQPVSRARLVLGKAAGLAIALSLALLTAWPAFVLANAYAGMKVSATGFLAAITAGIPLMLIFLAVALWAGAAMRSRTIAGLAASAAAVAAYFLFILGSAVAELETPRRLTPFYWSDASHVLLQGFDWTRTAGELAVAAVCLGLALWSFARRDIGTGAREPVRWWRRAPRPASAGAARAAEATLGGVYAGRLGLARKTLRDVRVAALASGFTTFAAALLLVVLYPLYRDALQDVVYPGALQGLLGEAGSFASPEGFMSSEFFSLVPLILLTVAIIMGTSAIAGEEGAETLDVLLAQPLSRARLLLVKATPIATALTLAALAALPGFWLARQFADMDLATGRFAAAIGSTVLLTLLFFALALWAGAAMPDRAAAAMFCAAALVAGYLVNTLGVTVDWLAGPRKLTPFYWADASHALVDGFDPARAALLVLATAALFAAALWQMQRRDFVTGRRERGLRVRLHLRRSTWRRHTPSPRGTA